MDTLCFIMIKDRITYQLSTDRAHRYATVWIKANTIVCKQGKNSMQVQGKEVPYRRITISNIVNENAQICNRFLLF